MKQRAMLQSEAPTFHGDDKAAAIKAAKARGGMCVYSLAPNSAPPGSADAKYGYWSDDHGLIRNWEQEIPLNESKKRRTA